MWKLCNSFAYPFLLSPSSLAYFQSNSVQPLNPLFFSFVSWPFSIQSQSHANCYLVNHINNNPNTCVTCVASVRKRKHIEIHTISNDIGDSEACVLFSIAVFSSEWKSVKFYMWKIAKNETLIHTLLFEEQTYTLR